jgi:hypothetical protein
VRQLGHEPPSVRIGDDLQELLHSLNHSIRIHQSALMHLTQPTLSAPLCVDSSQSGTSDHPQTVASASDDRTYP